MYSATARHHARRAQPQGSAAIAQHRDSALTGRNLNPADKKLASALDRSADQAARQTINTTPRLIKRGSQTRTAEPHKKDGARN